MGNRTTLATGIKRVLKDRLDAPATSRSMHPGSSAVCCATCGQLGRVRHTPLSNELAHAARNRKASVQRREEWRTLHSAGANGLHDDDTLAPSRDH